MDSDCSSLCNAPIIAECCLKREVMFQLRNFSSLTIAKREIAWRRTKQHRFLVFEREFELRKPRIQRDLLYTFSEMSLFRWRGPSMTIDTAARGVREGESDRQQSPPLPRRFSHTCAPGLRIMAGCPTLRTRPVASPPSPPHVHAHLALSSHKAYTPSEIHNVYTHVVSRRETREVDSSRSLSHSLMYARSICWYKTDVSRIALRRYASLSI